VTVPWRVSLPLDGSRSGGDAVSAPLQLLLQGADGRAVAAEVASLMVAAVTAACSEAALRTQLLGACPAGATPVAVSDPETQLQARASPAPPASGGGASSAAVDTTKGGACAFALAAHWSRLG